MTTRQAGYPAPSNNKRDRYHISSVRHIDQLQGSLSSHQLASSVIFPEFGDKSHEELEAAQPLQPNETVDIAPSAAVAEPRRST